MAFPMSKATCTPLGPASGIHHHLQNSEVKHGSSDTPALTDRFKARGSVSLFLTKPEKASGPRDGVSLTQNGRYIQFPNFPVQQASREGKPRGRRGLSELNSILQWADA